jgi:hypothetical protein
VRLEPLYRARFTTPESWSAKLTGPAGTEGRSFLLAEGRCEGRISGRYRGANFPRHRVDGVLTPDFRGVLETDDGASILFSWQAYTRQAPDGRRHLVGGMTHLSGVRALPLAQRCLLRGRRRGAVTPRRRVRGGHGRSRGRLGATTGGPERLGPD